MTQSPVCGRGIRFGWWVVVLVVVCLVVAGCGNDRGDGGEVVDGDLERREVVPVAPGAGVVVQSAGETGEGPDSGNLDGGSPVSGGPEAGDGEGSAGETGEPTEGVALPGVSGEATSPELAELIRGGLVLFVYSEVRPFVNEIVDLCDDSAAILEVNRRLLGSDEVAFDIEWAWNELIRVHRQVDCDEPGGRRYVYMSWGGVIVAHPTIAEAEAFKEEYLARGDHAWKRRPDGKLLGYHGMFRREFPLEARDEVVVLGDTVSVAGGVVRGLVHNLSESLYARDVVVSAGDLSWRWPLTAQPGERAPFEIEGWQGSDDPADVDLSVTADMSTVIDLSRAFDIGESWPEPQRGSYVSMSGLLTEPTSPPGLGEAIRQQSIDDLRAYFAVLDINTGTVTDVVQGLVFYPVWHDDGTVSVPREIVIDSYPVSADSLPEHYTFLPSGHLVSFGSGLNVESYTNYDLQVWFGGATPPPAKQTPNDDAADSTE